jgi:hypothetical protein
LTVRNRQVGITESETSMGRIYKWRAGHPRKSVQNMRLDIFVEYPGLAHPLGYPSYPL